MWIDTGQLGSDSVCLRARGLEVCGIYVDLNQIRAGEALTPESSTHTSAYDRICGWQQRNGHITTGSIENLQQPNSAMPPDRWLCELMLNEAPGVDLRERLCSQTPWRASDKGLLPLTLEKYLELLDWTGRQVREGSRETIPESLAPILQRLSLNPEKWLDAIDSFDRWFGHVVGSLERLTQRAARAGRKWFKGTPPLRRGI